MGNGITTYVGLDAHKVSITVAMLVGDAKQAVVWQVTNEPGAIRRMVRKVERASDGDVRFCYEAGPCGYALQRRIVDTGLASCMVVAPSLIPKKPGDQVKTDRRDAKKLAEMFRGQLLTEVHPPTEEAEAARDLCRARNAIRTDLFRARHRVRKFLVRQGLAHSGKGGWTQAFHRWLRELRFERSLEREVLDDRLLAIDQLEERLRAMDVRIKTLSQEAPYAEAVSILRCFRGIDTTTAMILVTELHSFGRFTTARQVMAFLGLIPSEHSSGTSRSQGPITKMGNGHVRRILIEASWNYRHRPAVGPTLRKRREGQPQWVIELADRAMVRLSRRFNRLVHKGKHPATAIVAVAREFSGFVWAALQPRMA